MGGGRAGVTGQVAARGTRSVAHGKGLRTSCCISFGLGAVHHGFDNECQ